MQYVISLLSTGILLLAAYGDVRTRRIPNILTLAVAVLGLMRLVLIDDLTSALFTIAAAAAVFAIGFLLFWRGLLGGGDVKLMAASVLLVGAPALSLFLVAMSLCGLVVTLATLVADRLARRPATPDAASGSESRLSPHRALWRRDCRRRRADPCRPIPCFMVSRNACQNDPDAAVSAVARRRRFSRH